MIFERHHRHLCAARVGRQYAQVRRADPSIEQAILDALGSAATVVNVGAGTGSFEPRDRSVIAVELSATMLAQRLDEAAPAVQAWAENLPFDDNEFDAAMAVLTVHHWIDCHKGLAEMRRVSQRGCGRGGMLRSCHLTGLMPTTDW